MQSKFKINHLVVALGIAVAMPSAMAASFSFGVMSDTQWTANTSGGQDTVATGIIDSINTQFINSKVDFVVQVGDLTDNGSSTAMQTRADHAQALYSAGIGFMPLRGNHENSAAAATQFQSLYGQTQNTVGSHQLVGASNFNTLTGSQGLTYSFAYKGATFVMLDQFTQTGQNVDQAQVTWVNGVLSSKSASSNAFVFGHKGLITENHADTLFGSNPSVATGLQNQFMSSLANNGVHYYFGGHDHIDNRAVIASPDGTSKVQDITTASNSYKFYTPQTGANINDVKYDNPQRETLISQQLYSVGYYIVNVDGPKVTVDFYSSPSGVTDHLTSLPTLNYTKQETFGYSLNGKEFLVAAGASFAGISDSIAAGDGFLGTSMSFKSGVNGNNVNVFDGRGTVADVNTGWTSKDELGDAALRSDQLTLWGVSDLSNTSANSVTLEMSYTGDGPVRLVRKINGVWEDAGIGMGFDAATHKAWANVSLSAIESGDFAVAAVPEPETYAMFLAGLGLMGLMARRRSSK